MQMNSAARFNQYDIANNVETCTCIYFLSRYYQRTIKRGNFKFTSIHGSEFLSRKKVENLSFEILSFELFILVHGPRPVILCDITATNLIHYPGPVRSISWAKNTWANLLFDLWDISKSIHIKYSYPCNLVCLNWKTKRSVTAFFHT